MRIEVLLPDDETESVDGVGRLETDGELAVYDVEDRLRTVYADGYWRKVVVVDGGE